MAFTVQYMEHLTSMLEWEVQVVGMWVYHVVLGLPRLQSRNPDLDVKRVLSS